MTGDVTAIGIGARAGAAPGKATTPGGTTDGGGIVDPGVVLAGSVAHWWRATAGAACGSGVGPIGAVAPRGNAFAAGVVAGPIAPSASTSAFPGTATTEGAGAGMG